VKEWELEWGEQEAHPESVMGAAVYDSEGPMVAVVDSNVLVEVRVNDALVIPKYEHEYIVSL
jgi:uncharacterized membrane protein affecting hemolysin expression